MKKFLLFICITLVSVQLNAQTSFGAKLGANFSSYYGDDADNIDGKTGLHLGFLSDISVNENMSVQPELLFSFEGADGVDINYIRIPVLAKYYPIEGLSFNFGPQLGVMVLAEDEAGNDLKDSVNSIDVGLIFGASYVLENGFFATASYNYGLTEVFENSDLKISMFQIGIGFQFPKANY